MASRGSRTTDAAAEAAPLDQARAAAGTAAAPPGGPGAADPLVAGLRRAGLLRLLVLHLSARGPSYGNQLMERIGELTGGLASVNPNTMYPLLRTLEADGLIAGEWEHPERRSRRFYTLTEAGEAERERLVGEIGPTLDRLADTVDTIRREVGGVSQVRAAVSAHGRVAEAEALWYDLSRRSAFVDGFKAVIRVSDDWPAAGELLWDSHPGGRGRVSERVTEHVAREGQTTRIEDEAISGTQTVEFASAGPETLHVSLALDYELKNRRLVVADWLFIRRAQRDSLRRTLNRFAIELDGERALAGA